MITVISFLFGKSTTVNQYVNQKSEKICPGVLSESFLPCQRSSSWLDISEFIWDIESCTYLPWINTDLNFYQKKLEQFLDLTQKRILCFASPWYILEEINVFEN